MKKLLSIIVVSLLLCGNGYANTPVENFVFKKLFDEYSYCTVYYKFLARSVERIELRNDDKLFAEEMNKLSEKSEINMIFFAKKISKPANDVQKNIQRIYESFLNIAGRDYSKTEILINQYTKSCENSLADPEVRMAYWDIEFQKKKGITKSKNNNKSISEKLTSKHGQEFDKDLTNKKLECLSNRIGEELTHYYFEFLKSDEVQIFEFSPYNYEISIEFGDVDKRNTEIKITYKPFNVKDPIFISRKTLNLKFYADSYKKWWDWWDCKILDNDFDIMSHLKSIKKNKMKKRLL